MIKFIFVKDPHFDITGNSSRRDDYLNSLYRKFDFLAAKAREWNIDALLIPGDIFLREEPKTVAHSLVSSMCSYFRTFPVPIHGILGNHDVRRGVQHFENYPISTLVNAGHYHRVDENPLVIVRDGVKVKVGGVSFQHNAYDLVMDYPRGDEDVLIMLAHFFISEYEGKFFKEDIHAYSSFSEASFDLLAVGHEHVNRGVFQESGKIFVDTGQMVRVTASDGNRTLTPTAVLIEIDETKDIKVTPFTVPHLSAEEVFGNEVSYDWAEEVDDWEEFADTVNSGAVFEFHKVRDMESLIMSRTDYSDDIRRKALDYVMEQQ